MLDQTPYRNLKEVATKRKCGAEENARVCQGGNDIVGGTEYVRHICTAMFGV
jgi:hypothetical protein